MQHKLPQLVMTSCDHRRLSTLAGAVLSRMPEVGEFLMRELDRAEIVARRIGTTTVAMGSRVKFALGPFRQDAERHLVYPGEENIAAGRYRS
jgi:regulator of nucleoside diphosphate kinase